MQSTERPTYLRGFDGLRGISIFLVILSHLGSQQWLPKSDFFQLRIWQILSGTAGVVIFFTISGFLITQLLLTEKALTGTIHLANFFCRRFLRLLPPLIIFYVLSGILMTANLIQREPAGLLLSAIYLYNFVPNFFYTSELGHTWSLAVEEQFYLTWPLVIRFKGRRAWLGSALLSLGLCLAATASLPGLLQQVNFTHHQRTYNAAQTFVFNRWFFPAAGPILLGCLTSVLLPTASPVFSSPQCLGLAFLLYLSPVWLPSGLLDFTTFAQAAGAALGLAWLSLNQRGRLADLLENRALTHIGKRSYGLYVYQGLFLRTGPGGTRWFQCWPWKMMLTFLLAWVSYWLVEKPVMKLKSRFR